MAWWTLRVAHHLKHIQSAALQRPGKAPQCTSILFAGNAWHAMKCAMHRQGAARGSGLAPAKPMCCVWLGPLVTGLEPGQLHCCWGHIDAWCHTLQNGSWSTRQCTSLQNARGKRYHQPWTAASNNNNSHCQQLLCNKISTSS